MLRGGLTKKYIDIPELIANIKFKKTLLKILSSKPLLRDENYYPAPVDGFLLSMIMLDKGEKYISSDRHAADKLFVYKGNLLGVECDEEKLTSSRGQSFLVAADQVMIMRYN